MTTKDVTTMDTDEARALLQAERDRLTALLSTTADNVGAQQRGDDPGNADVAKDVIDRELERSELLRVHEELREVDAAEERLAQGTYGVSEVSGEPIPDERLRAVPTARRLVPEQEGVEQQARATDPNNPDVRG